MYGSVFDDWYFLQHCFQRTENCSITQLNQLFQILHLVHIYGHGFYEFSRMQMRKNVNNDVSKDSPINRYAKTNIARVQAWGLSAMIKIWGWSVRFSHAGYSEEAILSNRLCLIEPHNIVHLKHVLLYKPWILLANIQAISPALILYKKKKQKQKTKTKNTGYLNCMTDNCDEIV